MAKLDEEKEQTKHLSLKAKVDAANDEIRGGSLLHAATEALYSAARILFQPREMLWT
jgi:hypothetical protein